MIVLIKFRRGIALRWAHWPGGHNANCDVYGMNREWNSKWDDWEGKKAPRSPTGKSSGKISAWKPVFPSLTHILNSRGADRVKWAGSIKRQGFRIGLGIRGVKFILIVIKYLINFFQYNSPYFVLIFLIFYHCVFD